MRYYEIIKEGYKEVQQKYVSAGVDPETIEKTFNTYKDLVNRNQVSGNERNIDWWGKQSFEQFKAFVDEKSAEKSSTQIKRSKIPGKSINLVDNDDWLVVIPLDKDASCFHGKGSDWCTTKQNQSHFEDYFYNNKVVLIYCLNKKTGGMWAIAAHKDTDRIEMFDQQDQSIDVDRFYDETDLSANRLVNLAMTHQQTIDSTRTVYEEALARIKEYITSADEDGDKAGIRNSQIEKDLMFTKDSEFAAEYMYVVRRKEDYPLALQFMAAGYNGGALNFIKNPSEKVQLVAVKTDPYEAISSLFDSGIVPSEAVQIAAVMGSGDVMDTIIYGLADIDMVPSEAVQLTAARHSFRAAMSIIRLLKNPSEQMLLTAVQRDASILKYINDPSIEMQIIAVKQGGGAIQYIKNPSEAVQLAAVQQNGFAIRFIKNPSEKVQWAAIKNQPNAIESIDNPSEEQQMFAVQESMFALSMIRNPTEKVQWAAIKKNPNAIGWIKNPSEEIQIFAVQSPFGGVRVLQYIKNPSQKVLQAAKDVGAGNKPEVDESNGLQSPGTYEQEYNPYKRHGQRRIGTLTSEGKKK